MGHRKPRRLLFVEADFLRLKTEHALDLVPDNDSERDAERDECDQHEPEAQTGAPHLALALPVSAAAGAVKPVRPLDCHGVEVQGLVRIEASHRLGHECGV